MKSNLSLNWGPKILSLSASTQDIFSMYFLYFFLVDLFLLESMLSEGMLGEGRESVRSNQQWLDLMSHR